MWSALTNRRSIVFRKNNARPYTSTVIRQKLGWNVFMNPTTFKIPTSYQTKLCILYINGVKIVPALHS